MRHLTDTELIDYTLKYDTDPVRVRLAKVMDNTSGILLDGLEFAGMDSETWLFENTWDAGQYIHHLKAEVDYLNDELEQAQNKIEDMKTKTVLELIDELKKSIAGAEQRIRAADNAKERAYKERDEMKNKLDMWAILNR